MYFKSDNLKTQKYRLKNYFMQKKHISKFFMFVSILIICMLALLIACSCSSTTTKTNNSLKVDFVDSCNRTVQVPQDINKVAVTGPPSQNLFLSFAPDKLVALSRDLTDEQVEVFGSNVASLPVLGQIYGGKGTFDKEALAKLNPDIIIDIGDSKSSISSDMDDLQNQVGIPCVHIDGTLDTYNNTYLQLGKLLNMQDRAKVLSDYFTENYSAALNALSQVDLTRALWIADENATSVVAKGSSQCGVMDIVTNNVAVLNDEKAAGAGNQVSLEQISIWNPAVILVGYKSTYDKVLTDEEWAGINAVKNKKVYLIPTFPYGWMGQPPSFMQMMGCEWLTNLLYPNTYNIDLRQKAKEFYKIFFNYDLSDDKYNEITNLSK